MFQQINSPRPGNVYCSVSCSVTSYLTWKFVTWLLCLEGQFISTEKTEKSIFDEDKAGPSSDIYSL